MLDKRNTFHATQMATWQREPVQSQFVPNLKPANETVLKWFSATCICDGWKSIQNVVTFREKMVWIRYRTRSRNCNCIRYCLFHKLKRQIRLKSDRSSHIRMNSVLWQWCDIDMMPFSTEYAHYITFIPLKRLFLCSSTCNQGFIISEVNKLLKVKKDPRM